MTEQEKRNRIEILEGLIEKEENKETPDTRRLHSLRLELLSLQNQLPPYQHVVTNDNPIL